MEVIFMNKITLIGNVVKELELKTYDSLEGKGIRFQDFHFNCLIAILF